MENIIDSVSVVIPIIFVLLFGLFSQRADAFGVNSNAIPVINELALKFALPLALFVGTVTVSRDGLFSDLKLFSGLALTLVLCYFVGFLVAKFLFKRNVIESSIAGLAVSCSSGAFYGPAILDSMYGSMGNVAVSMFAISFNVFVMPMAAVVINIGVSKRDKNEGSIWVLIGSSFYSSIFKTPFVWAPLLACVLVVLDVKVPDVVVSSFDLLGNTTAGIAVFVAGMTIATNKFKLNFEVISFSVLKNILAPFVFVFFGLNLLGMNHAMGSFNEGVLLSALPTAPLVVLLATKYKEYQQEASSILAVSTISMIVTLTFFVVLAKQ